ncbi:unnamed protein product, partial [Didymodactylos carnosus]
MKFRNGHFYSISSARELIQEKVSSDSDSPN